MTGKAAVLLLVALLTTGAILIFVGPVPQWPNYHDFADTRDFLGIPNAQNVISNLGFLIIGVWGAFFVSSRPGRRATGLLTAVYLVFFIGVLLTAPGSAYYHYQPDNQTLVWDRLPMTVAFMALFAAVLGELISVRLARGLLFPLLAMGMASVLWWAWTESNGAGDLRFYGLVQFLPFLLVPLLLIMYRAPGRFVFFLVRLGTLYALAKCFEMLDHQTYQALGSVVGGHALKHLFAATAAACVLLMLYGRGSRAGLIGLDAPHGRH
jgi:hypothetical protein